MYMERLRKSSKRFITIKGVGARVLGQFRTASVVQWSEFLATDTEEPGSIPGATRFSE
jgi:hypothetical protein